MSFAYPKMNFAYLKINFAYPKINSAYPFVFQYFYINICLFKKYVLSL